MEMERIDLPSRTGKPQSRSRRRPKAVNDPAPSIAAAQAAASSYKPFWLSAGIAVGFCAVFLFLVFSQAMRYSATYDEIAHLPAGYSYLRWQDYRLNPEHPPLVKKLAALPLLWLHGWRSRMDLTAPDQVPDAIPRSLLAGKQAWSMALANIDAQWLFGHFFLYGPRDATLDRLGIEDPLRIPSVARLSRDDFAQDADRLLLWGRFPVMLLGTVLALLVFSWARELYGLAGGALAMALFCFDPNFIAHSGLVTTDVGIAAFMFGAVYSLWRTCRCFSPLNAILTVVFVALAFATKFSAILLVPVLLLIGMARLSLPGEWPAGRGGRFPLRTFRGRALAVTMLIAGSLAASYAVLWASYDFRYSAASHPAQAAESESLSPAQTHPVFRSQPGRTPGYLPMEGVVRRTAAIRSLLRSYPQGPPEPEIQKAMLTAPSGVGEQLILFAARYHLLPEACLYGLAHVRMKSLLRGGYLMGEYSNRGFTSYFLWAFLLKTPLITIAAIAAACFFAWKRKVRWATQLSFLILPVGVYFLVSMVSNLNIGHRHILPVYPFLYVLCGGLAPEWASWRSAKRRFFAIAAPGAIILSAFLVFAPPWNPAPVYGHYLSYFNELAGGPRNGHNILLDSNIDWGQDLGRLGEWLRERQIEDPVNLCYFGTADPRYHGIPHINLPGGYAFEPEAAFSEARIPGYLAISATHLHGVYFSPPTRRAWQEFLDRGTYVERIGYSIFIFRLSE